MNLIFSYDCTVDIITIILVNSHEHYPINHFEKRLQRFIDFRLQTDHFVLCMYVLDQTFGRKNHKKLPMWPDSCMFSVYLGFGFNAGSVRTGTCTLYIAYVVYFCMLLNTCMYIPLRARIKLKLYAYEIKIQTRLDELGRVQTRIEV